MTAPARKTLVGKILFVSAILMLLGAGLIWTGAIPFDEPARAYAAGILGAVAAADLVMGMLFMRGGH
jgi:hypothetical protein